MRKAWLLLLVAVFAVCGVAIAADKIGTFGAPNSSGTYPMEVDSSRVINVASDATFGTDSGLYSAGKVAINVPYASSVASLQVGNGTPVVGSGMGTNDAYFSADVDIDGKLYLENSVFVDHSTYGTTQGVSFQGVNTCGCKRFVNGVCTLIGTCS